MSFATTSRATMRFALGPPRVSPTGSMARRGLATHEPQVSWAEYRAGDKTLAQWVEANRHVVAGGFFVFYASLAAWNLRPKKKKIVDATKAGEEQSLPAADAVEGAK